MCSPFFSLNAGIHFVYRLVILILVLIFTLLLLLLPPLLLHRCDVENRYYFRQITHRTYIQ